MAKRIRRRLVELGRPGVSLLPGIALVRNAAGQLDVFAVHQRTGELWHAHQKSQNSLEWSSWSSLGGSLQSPATAAENADGSLEVFALASDGSGRTDKEVGVALNLSVKTIRNCLDRIFGKLGVHTRTEAALIYAGQRINSNS